MIKIELTVRSYVGGASGETIIKKSRMIVMYLEWL